MVCPKHHQGRKLHDSQGALKIVQVMFFSRNGLALFQPMSMSTIISSQYYYALMQDKVMWFFTIKQPEMFEHGVILLEDNATPVSSSLTGTSGK